MADVDRPKTHVENQDLDAPRKQPESPQHEGIDPLTEGDTMYPATDTKSDSERLDRKEAKAEPQTVSEDTPSTDTASPDEAEQATNNRDEPSSATSQRTTPVKADGKTQPQTAKPTQTNAGTTPTK